MDTLKQKTVVHELYFHLHNGGLSMEVVDTGDPEPVITFETHSFGKLGTSLVVKVDTPKMLEVLGQFFIDASKHTFAPITEATIGMNRIRGNGLHEDNIRRDGVWIFREPNSDLHGDDGEDIAS